MSGAELIAVLGITSSVVSIIDAVSKIMDRVRAFRESVAFQDLLVQLPLLVSVIDGLNTPKYQGLLDEATQQALSRVLEGCLRQLRKLEKLIQSMTPLEAASKFEKTWKGIRSFGKDTKLREILGILTEYKSTITLHLSSVHVQNSGKQNITPESPKSYFDVPSSRLSHFVGRSEVFEKIEQTIGSSEIRPPVIVLTGAGGQGKTQVALEFCHRKSSSFKGVFWVDASSEISATRSYGRILKALGGDPSIEDKKDVKTAVKTILRDWDEAWLLVFDNFDDPNHFTNLRTFFPDSKVTSKSGIILTSRHVVIARLGVGIALSGLSEEQGLELLLSRSFHASKTDGELNQGKEIVKKLGYLALAIDQASAYISIRQLPLHIFIEHFETRKEFILKDTPQSTWEYRSPTADESNLRSQNLSVLTTWELSFDQISGSDEERAQIGDFLMQAAFFHPMAVTESLFCNFHQFDNEEPLVWKHAFETQNAWDPFKFQDIVVGLVNLSLVQGLEISNEGVAFSLHPIIMEWLHFREPLLKRQRRTLTAIAMTASLIERSDTEKIAFKTRQELLAHTDSSRDNRERYLTMIEDIVTYGGFVEGFQTTFATFYGEHDRYKDAEKIFLQSLALQKQKLGNENIATLATLNNLGALYVEVGELNKAKDSLQLALKVKESLLGLQHPRTLNTVNNIGNLLVLMYRYDEAAMMYQRTLEGYSRINGPNHKTVVESMNNLGEVAMKKGELKRAEQIFEMAFKTAKTLADGRHDALTLYLGANIALVYKLQQRYEEAVQVYTEVVVVGREKLLGTEHSSTLQSMCEVADVYVLLRNESQANDWYRRGKANPERRARGSAVPKTMSMSLDQPTEHSRNTNSGSKEWHQPSSKRENSTSLTLHGPVETVASWVDHSDRMEWEASSQIDAPMAHGSSLSSYPQNFGFAPPLAYSGMPSFIDRRSQPVPQMRLPQLGGIDRRGLPPENFMGRGDVPMVLSPGRFYPDQTVTSRYIERQGIRQSQHPRSEQEAPSIVPGTPSIYVPMLQNPSHDLPYQTSNFGSPTFQTTDNTMDIDLAWGRSGLSLPNSPVMSSNRIPVPNYSSSIEHGRLSAAQLPVSNPWIQIDGFVGGDSRAPATSLNLAPRPERKCEYIERGGVCMHNSMCR